MWGLTCSGYACAEIECNGKPYKYSQVKVKQKHSSVAAIVSFAIRTGQ